jgi:hypothetical protein
MENVQNCDSYINIPSSQTYRSYTSNCIYIYPRHITRQFQQTCRASNISVHIRGISDYKSWKPLSRMTENIDPPYVIQQRAFE